MILSSFHTHTTFCDGSSTVDEMIRAALDAGMSALGFSGHSVTPFDLRYCTQPEDMPRYAAAVRAAKAAYAGQIEIYLGVEDDFCGLRPDFDRDFTIGSMHHMPVGDRFIGIDESAEVQQRLVNEGFGGDVYKMTAVYFEAMSQVLDRTGCDFVGHIDLVAKFNEGGRYFDEADPRYLGPALACIEHLCRRDAVFEINTGAISRGYRTSPYPAVPLLRAIRDFGGAIVLSSDSHSADTVCFGLREAAELAAACGFRTHRVLTPAGWEDAPLGCHFPA